LEDESVFKRQFATSGEFVNPDEPVRIAFLFQVASFWPSIESFYQSCLNDDKFDVKIYVVLDDVDQSKQLKTARNFLEGMNISYSEFNYDDFIAFSPHIAFLQTPYDILQRKPHLYSRRLKNMGIRVAYIPYGIELVDTAAARHDHFREPVLKNAWRIYTVSSNDNEYINKWVLPNIGAFQVTSDTRKYIDGVFHILSVPWGFIPDDNILSNIRNIIKNHYDKTKLQLFDEAVRMNYHLNAKKLKSFTVIDLPSVLQKYKGKYILFGQRDAENYIKMIRSAGFNLPLEIWDNKVYGGEIFDVPIVKPHEGLDDKTAIIFTVRAKNTYIGIFEKLPNSLKSHTYWFE